MALIDGMDGLGLEMNEPGELNRDVALRADFERRLKLGRPVASCKADERELVFVKSRREWEAALVTACGACTLRMYSIGWREWGASGMGVCDAWDASGIGACDAWGYNDAGEKEQWLGGLGGEKKGRKRASKEGQGKGGKAMKVS
jgi:hypothetical protein